MVLQKQGVFGYFRAKELFYFCNPFTVKLSGVAWRLITRSLLLPLQTAIQSGNSFWVEQYLNDDFNNNWLNRAKVTPLDVNFW